MALEIIVSKDVEEKIDKDIIFHWSYKSRSQVKLKSLFMIDILFYYCFGQHSKTYYKNKNCFLETKRSKYGLGCFKQNSCFFINLTLLTLFTRHENF